MKKWFLIIPVLIVLSSGVSSFEGTYISFNDLECSDLGVLSFKAGYEWNSYNGYYADLKNVNVSIASKDVTEELTGYWYKFKDKSFSISRINLNSLTAYYFSKPGSLKEGKYKVTVDYVTSRNDINYFKNKFTGNVNCPAPREIVQNVEEVKIVKRVIEEKKDEETVTPSVGEPPLIDKSSENYVVYYLVGLWITLFIISTLIARKFYKKYPKVRKKVVSGGEESVLEKK